MLLKHTSNLHSNPIGLVQGFQGGAWFLDPLATQGEAEVIQAAPLYDYSQRSSPQPHSSPVTLRARGTGQSEVSSYSHTRFCAHFPKASEQLSPPYPVRPSRHLAPPQLRASSASRQQQTAEQRSRFLSPESREEAWSASSRWGPSFLGFGWVRVDPTGVLVIFQPSPQSEYRQISRAREPGCRLGPGGSPGRGRPVQAVRGVYKK